MKNRKLFASEPNLMNAKMMDKMLVRMHHLCRGTGSNFKIPEEPSPWSPVATCLTEKQKSFQDFAAFKSKGDHNQIYSPKCNK